MNRLSLSPASGMLRALCFALVTLVSAAHLPGASAETPDLAAQQQALRGQYPDAHIDLSNPREMMRTFLSNMRAEKEDFAIGRWRAAALTLNLDRVPELNRARRAQQAAFDLHEIINRLEFVQYENIPEDPGAPRYVFWSPNSIPIAASRDADGFWRIDYETIYSIPDLVRAVEGVAVVEGLRETQFIDSPTTWFRTNLPSWFFERTLILENFQWIALFVFIFLGFILDRFVRTVLRSTVSKLLAQKDVSVDEEPVEGVARWTGWAVAGIIWLIGLQWIALPDRLVVVLWAAALFFAIGAIILAAMAIIDLAAAILQVKAGLTKTKFDDILIPLIRKTAKVFVIAFGVVFLADNLKLDITSLLAGLGIGGLAFALAAKDTVENVFGSIAILVDRPFQIGDWVRISDVEGTVEVVGLRSTRIRTFYNSLITVPNSNLIKANVDNLGLRRYRRVLTTISVTYNTPPERIDSFCEGMREIIRKHPYTRKDFYHIWLNEFGDHSLDILVYAFVETPDWATELREKHRMFLDFIRLAHRLGVEFAFPTQTLYLERGSGSAQPNPAPFKSRSEVMAERAAARQHVEEMVDRLLREPGVPFPPPPVSFTAPMDTEEMALHPRNRGGSVGDGAGGEGDGT